MARAPKVRLRDPDLPEGAARGVKYEAAFALVISLPHRGYGQAGPSGQPTMEVQPAPYTDGGPPEKRKPSL